jgi:hypothetical protein
MEEATSPNNRTEPARRPGMTKLSYINICVSESERLISYIGWWLETIRKLVDCYLCWVADIGTLDF